MVQETIIGWGEAHLVLEVLFTQGISRGWKIAKGFRGVVMFL